MKKPWYQSKTIIGLILTVVQLILKSKGIELPVIGADNGAILTGALTAYGFRDAIGGGLSAKPV